MVPAFVALLALLVPPTAMAETYALSDSQYPYLAITHPPVFVEWHQKGFSLALAQSQVRRCIRLARGGCPAQPACT